MERKKWTPNIQITDSLLKSREKKKWQLALRRYVLEKNISAGYAWYFGLEIEQMRCWIALQFTNDLNWENFGSAWQFDHIVPMSYFNFSKEEELILCWNFINISVQRLDNTHGGIDILASRPYFERLYSETSYPICLKMVQKIALIEEFDGTAFSEKKKFIKENTGRLEKSFLLDKEEFNQLNQGVGIDDILLEREILRKFG